MVSNPTVARTHGYCYWLSSTLRFSNFCNKQDCGQTFWFMVTTLSLSSWVGSHQSPGCLIHQCSDHLLSCQLCWCHLCQLWVRRSGQESPYPFRQRFGEPFKGPIIPFGSLVEYYPINAKDQSRTHQFGKKVLPGLFLGYALYAEGIRKGDVLVADIEELDTMDASAIYSQRLNAKEVIFPKQGEFIFPIKDGRIKLSRRDQELRTPALILRGSRSHQWRPYSLWAECTGSLRTSTRRKKCDRRCER